MEEEGGNNNALLDRSYIEEKIIEINACHFQQAKNTPTFTDETCDKLKNESVRNKVLNGILRRNECDANGLCGFLKLIKQPKYRRNANVVEMSEEKFVRAAKGSKKRRASSVFSGRAHAAYECSILSKIMLSVLVMFHNMALMQKCCPLRWIKTLETCIEKGKGPLLGKLRNLQSIEGGL